MEGRTDLGFEGQAKLLTWTLFSPFISHFISPLSSPPVIQTMTAPYWLHMLDISLSHFPGAPALHICNLQPCLECVFMYSCCGFERLCDCVHSVLLVCSPPFPSSLVSSPLILLRPVLISSLFFPLFSLL